MWKENYSLSELEEKIQNLDKKLFLKNKIGIKVAEDVISEI